MREGVRTLVELEDDLSLVGACEDYDGLIDLVGTHEPDVVLTDIRMPPTGTDEGVRAACQLRETHPHIGVVVLSNYLEPSYALSLFAAGAQGRGYLLKERVSDGEQLATLFGRSRTAAPSSTHASSRSSSKRARPRVLQSRH